MKKPLLVLGLLAALAAPAAAAAADTTVAADPAAEQVTALDGTIVWVSGKFGAQTLMRRTSDGTVGRVPGAPTARLYRTVDLGRDTGGDLVLTYLRCTSVSRCEARSDDLAGHRRSFKLSLPSGCALSTAPSVWRDRIAYGLGCRTGSRGGLYVKTGAHTPRKLRLPRDAERFGADTIEQVDLRGTRVAAVAADIYEYAFSQSVTGTGMRSFLAAASEGESEESARGLALDPTSVLWALVDAEHTGDPNLAVIHRMQDTCQQWERLANASPDESGFKAIDLAVDGSALYLVVPGTGIVAHPFTPERTC